MGAKKNLVMVNLKNPSWVFIVWTHVGPLSAYFMDIIKDEGSKRGQKWGPTGHVFTNNLLRREFGINISIKKFIQ
jgi:hypothetical protein